MGRRQQGEKRRSHKKGPDARLEVEVDMEDFYNGGEVSARISRNVVCRRCTQGTPEAKSARCRACQRCPNETRMVNRRMGPGFMVQMQEEVPSKEKCKNEAKTLTATIEKGMGDGHEVTFERESEQRPGMIPGDVIFRLRQKSHPRFERKGDNLETTVHLTLRESLLGFRKVIKQLDGSELVVSHDGITRPFEKRTVQGHGMPVHNVPSTSGDLIVTYEVDFPTQLTSAQTRAVSEAFTS